MKARDAVAKAEASAAKVKQALLADFAYQDTVVQESARQLQHLEEERLLYCKLVVERFIALERAQLQARETALNQLVESYLQIDVPKDVEVG